LFPKDSIVAPATAPGDGGIAIIRFSGDRSEEFLSQHFIPTSSTRPFLSHRFYHGHIRDLNGHTIDEVMAVIMRAPKSFTREDVVEIHCHGGSVVTSLILDLAISSGIRLARPGEFTLRAFLNGRIDLARAEAVADLIRSRSEGAARIAVQQLQGKLSTVLHSYKDSLVQGLTLIEAFIDFSEDEVGQFPATAVREIVEKVCSDIRDLIGSFDTGRVLREGIAVLILGKPNVGKSSLLNALLGETRAIVTEIPGTTRDTIEESLVIDGIPLRLIDSAGVRITQDPVEAEGVKRAQSKVASADLVLLVVDGHSGIDDSDKLAFHACEAFNPVLIVNKCDLTQVGLVPPFDTMQAIYISTRNRNGLDNLRSVIKERFIRGDGADSRESVVLSDRRHREALVRSLASLTTVLDLLDKDSPLEFLALELRDSLSALGEITGETTPDDVLNNIFNKFCIGK